MNQPPELDLGLEPYDRARTSTRSAAYTPKTVPTHPHEYVVPEQTTDPAGHYAMVKWINRTGTSRTFAGKRYKYAEVDGYVHWIGPRTIINRRRSDVIQDDDHYPD